MFKTQQTDNNKQLITTFFEISKEKKYLKMKLIKEQNKKHIKTKAGTVNV